MSLIVSKKQSGRVLPRFVENLLNSDRFLSPRFMEFENMFDTDMTVTIPEANIIENAKSYNVQLAVPGMKRDDFKVEVEHGMLSISSEKEETKKEEEENYRRREFFYSSFSRSFTLPENSIAEKIDAKYENGILNITIPKKEVSVAKTPTQIKVS